MKTIHRFHSNKAASLVRDAMRPLTNVSVYVDHIPVSEGDIKRGTGDFAIVADITGSSNTRTLCSCVNAAIALVLTDALAKHEPNHPIIRDTWHLRSENRDKLAKYLVETTC